MFPHEQSQDVSIYGRDCTECVLFVCIIFSKMSLGAL